jgi:hypothetical protein
MKCASVASVDQLREVLSRIDPILAKFFSTALKSGHPHRNLEKNATE